MDEHSASSSPIHPEHRSPPKKEENRTIDSRLAQLAESREELVEGIQELKQELQNWRVKLDTQVKSCTNELFEIKILLSTELEKFKSEFLELRSTLHLQQDEVTSSLKSLGLQDSIEEPKCQENSKNSEGVEGCSEPSDV
ncbi:uveal autoantigen with coiled-coil/ankyrin isoform X1 [Wolffia australiana]